MNTPTPHPFDQGDRRIRLPEVVKITGLAKRTIYRRIAEKIFPAPIKDGRVSVWWHSQVLAYANKNHGGLPA